MQPGERFIASDGSLRVVPYEHKYVASVKGRWLGRPLLDAFTSEFAAVVAPDDDSSNLSASVSTSWKSNLVTYATEMAAGTLRIRGREEESRRAGSQILQHIEEHISSSKDLAEAVTRIAPVAVLRQNEWIEHVVRRCEGHISSFQPVEVISCAAAVDSPIRFLAVNKPHGLPVHPSGRFHRLSVTRILEDVFGGVDAAHFEACVTSDRSVEIRHSEHKYVLARLSKDLPEEELKFFTSQLRGGAEKATLRGLKVFVVHRLDTCTGGVLLFGLDSSSARRMTAVVSEKAENSEGWCTKEYVARVKGDFRSVVVDSSCAADQWILVRRPIYCRSYFESTYGCPTDEEIAQLKGSEDETVLAAAVTLTDLTNAAVPLVTAVKRQRDELDRSLTVEEKRAIMKDRALGSRAPESSSIPFPNLRGAASLFKFCRYDGDESIVQCRPLTGRTHQLRVHLSWLGFPIANDAKYNSSAPCAEQAPATSESGLIFLHSRRYELHIALSAEIMFSVVVEAPLPEWAL